MKKFIVTKQYKSGSTLPTVVAWFDDAKDAQEYARLSNLSDKEHKYVVYWQN
jgi:hypothetical protein